MTLDFSIKLYGPVRCIIYYLKKKFNKYSQNPYDFFFVEKIVEYAFGDYQKINFFDTVIEKDAFIIFDYNNPDHLNACRMLGFRIRRSVKSIFISAEVVHSRVNK
jgi:hypothetical protein